MEILLLKGREMELHLLLQQGRKMILQVLLLVVGMMMIHLLLVKGGSCCFREGGWCHREGDCWVTWRGR